MAVASDTVWAIDLGNNCLKALRLTTAGGIVQVIGFDNIQHGKILSGSGVKAAERDELIALSLRQFVQRDDLGDDEIIISVPSQNSFARFVNLPPVEPKRIPEIVNFEAVQQIPFDMNDVQWDWQLMTEADSPEKKVGIFAIKNEVVNFALEHFNRENLTVSYVQMAPMALYNYVLHDHADLLTSVNQAVILLNVGAENTDLVVCTKATVWQRCILIGGNAFTRAIAEAFKLNFEKAEKLKRTAPVSKYARQILQAMKPVFTDLVSEVQRSLGFYSSSNPNAKFLKIIALGGGTKLRGLLKYLQQTLQIPVERPDSFKRLAIGSGVSAAKFHENVSDFGVVYGLALQGLGLAGITSNLLPRSIARSMAWASKSKYFIAAACLLLVVSLMGLARTGWDRINYRGNSEIREEIGQVVSQARQASDLLEAEASKGSGYEAIIKKQFEPFKYRQVVPLLHKTILSALPNAENNPAQRQLYEAFANNDVATVKAIARKQRKQVYITKMSVYFSDDLATAQFGATAMMRRSRMGTGGAEEEYYDEEYEMMMEEMMGMEGAGAPSPYALDFTLGGEQTQVEKKRGFVVTIAGYSPYENIGELLDPAGVEEQPDRWGFVTRLLHLDDMIPDGNSPFELYNRASAEHFRLDKGPVDLAAEMPAGIGIIQEIPAIGGQTVTSGPAGFSAAGVKQVLIDPMTKEVISKVAELDQYGQPRMDRKGTPIYEIKDNWFVLNFKFVWRDAPAPPEPAVSPASPYGYPRPAPPTPPAASSTGGLGIDGQFE